jgi:ABC-2 type transport system ATP-binding protein
MIEIIGLQKIIEGRTALDIAEFRISEGEVACVVGPAASGKEILLDLLIGRTRPSAGKVRVAGIDPRVDPAGLSRRVGIMFYEDGLYPGLSPKGNLRFFCQLQGLPSARADEVLEQIGLADRAESKLDKLPLSLHRRLSFGRTILHNPGDLILEEPFARCDESTIAILSGLIRLWAEADNTVLILADDAAHLEGICDLIYDISDGRISASPRKGPSSSIAEGFRIPVRLEGSVALVNPGEVLFAEAEEGHAILVTIDARMESQFTLSELEQRLGRSGFFRAHRGYLVNLQHIKEVIPFTRNSYSLRLDDPQGTLIPLSRRAATELRELLGF